MHVIHMYIFCKLAKVGMMDGQKAAVRRMEVQYMRTVAEARPRRGSDGGSGQARMGIFENEDESEWEGRTGDEAWKGEEVVLSQK